MCRSLVLSALLILVGSASAQPAHSLSDSASASLPTILPGDEVYSQCGPSGYRIPGPPSALRGQPPALIHALGAALLGGRLAHAFGVRQEDESYRFRTIGMWLTFIPIVAASLMNLSWAAAQWV